MTALAWGMGLILLASFVLYLASPNQLVWTGGLARRPLASAGAGLAVVGLMLLLQWAGPATAVFIAITAIMLVWTIVPLTAAWLRGDRKVARAAAAKEAKR